MQRSKQQALAFLLGATLVGGVLGFSAERLLDGRGTGGKIKQSWAQRQWMYEDLGLNPEQILTIDSVIEATRKQVDSLWRPMRPTVDSINTASREAILAQLNPEQRARFEERVRQQAERRKVREREAAQRREAERAQIDSLRKIQEFHQP
jgi:hypothetical protein